MLVKTLKSFLQSHFKIKNLGQVAIILGIEEERENSTGSIKLSQKGTIDLVLEYYDMTDCKPVRTPVLTKISSIQKESKKTVM